MASLFLVRIVSHSGWTVNAKPNPWPLGWWVGTRESDWGPSPIPHAVKRLQDADMFESRSLCEKAVDKLHSSYPHVGFEAVEFVEKA